MKIYKTLVEPGGNISPGENVFTSSVTLPDSSMADGSTQLRANPSDIISSGGQFLICGARLSTKNNTII